jgi:hypothetical protein
VGECRQKRYRQDGCKQAEQLHVRSPGLGN